MAAAISPGVAMAADFTVNTTADPAPDGSCGPPDCSLREAVTLAGDADRVILPAGTYVLSLGELVLIGDTIVGAGARSTIIDGNQVSRVLRISAPAAGGLATSTVSGVTIRGGNGVGSAQGIGGGVLLQSSPLLLTNSHVVANTATSTGGGIGIQGNNSLVMVGSTVAGNTVTGRSVEGGGIGVSGENAGIGLVNSTVSGNAAVATIGSSAGGGIHAGLTPRLVLGNVTIASNSASAGGGLALNSTANPQFANQMINTALAGNTGGACLPGTGLPAVQTHHNLVQDSTCALAGTGDIQGIDAQLLALANNGGPTDTRALPAGSPAIDMGGTCQQTDQRGIPRPAAACDIGAFEHVAPTLRVVTQVVNDAGGTRTADQFNVHVRLGGSDVTGSPQAGSATGTTYTLTAGSTYSIAADGVTGYVLTLSGDCAANGSITLQEGQARTCTITANDTAQPSVNAQQLPPPQAGRSVNALPKSGTVKVRLPGSAAYIDLDEAQQLPVGTVVDARKGHVTLIAAADDSGGTATAEFWAGIFRLTQTKGATPITVLTLVEKLSCPKAGKAVVAAKKKKRRLWGDGSGKFRTKGKHSAATVVGTKWLVEDRCKSTLTRVVRGRVSVRDFVKKKTMIVRAGKRYVAKARR